MATRQNRGIFSIHLFALAMMISLSAWWQSARAQDSAKTAQDSASDAAPIVYERINVTDLAKLSASPGTNVLVEGKISSAKPSSSGKVFIIDFHGASSNGFSAVIFPRALPKIKASLKGDPATILPEKTVEIRGKLQLYRNRPEIVINTPEQLTISASAPPAEAAKPGKP